MYAQAPVAGGATAPLRSPCPTAPWPTWCVRHRGDGAGFVMTGLGCDGNEFAIDALRLHTAGTATTYDLEGLATIGDHAAPARAPRRRRADLELRGTLVDSTGAAAERGHDVLESRAVGSSTWEVDAGRRRRRHQRERGPVRPSAGTSYRWRFADRPMAEGSVSAPFTVQVVGGVSADLVGTGPSARSRASSPRPPRAARRCCGVSTTGPGGAPRPPRSDRWAATASTCPPTRPDAGR